MSAGAPPPGCGGTPSWEISKENYQPLRSGRKASAVERPVLSSQSFGATVKTFNDIPSAWVVAVFRAHSTFAITDATVTKWLSKGEKKFRQAFTYLTGSSERDIYTIARKSIPLPTLPSHPASP